jgi:hypothetical protein
VSVPFYRKNKGYDQEHRNGREGSQDGQDGRETVASQWLRAELQRYSDSNVELNDTMLVVVLTPPN